MRNSQQHTMIDSARELTLDNGWEKQQRNPVTWVLGEQEYGGVIELSVLQHEDENTVTLCHQRQPVESSATHITTIENPTREELRALIRFTAYRIADNKYDGYAQNPGINTGHIFSFEPEDYVVDILSFLVETYNDEYVQLETPFRLTTE